MRKSNASLAKLGLKYSTHIDTHNRSYHEGRESETSDLLDTTHYQLRRVNTSSRQLYSHDLSASTRLSRRSSNKPRTSPAPGERQNLEKMVSQLKEQYAKEARMSRYSNLVKAKSEHNFTPSPRVRVVAEQRGKRSIEEIQQKISQYNKSNRLATVKSESKLLEMPKSLQRSTKLTEKTQKCRQLCLQIKRKLFKDTVSTTTSEVPRRSLSISDFRLQKLIGSGKFSKVYIARYRHRRSGVIVAVKIIKKETIKRENFLEQLVREIKIQSFLSHVNLVKLYAFFHDTLNIYLILEFCVGGQLYDLFRVKSKLREDEWQPLMKGVCQGLFELHRHGVIHRDLKPENIVLSFGIPKIGDFGWSVYSCSQNRDTFCGTPLYISPELLLGNSYDRQVDIWALGVMMYEFLTGRIPFKIQYENNLLQIVNSTIVYPKFLSEDCLSLMRMILEKDPSSRIGILDILQHPFLNKNLQSSSSPYNLFKISR